MNIVEPTPKQHLALTPQANRTEAVRSDNVIPAAFGSHVATAYDTRPRSRRSAPRVIAMETPTLAPQTQKAAESLVIQGDRDVARQFAATLMRRVISLDPGGSDTRASRIVSNIPPYSTFGQAWAHLTQALKKEPFATYAKAHGMDTSAFNLNLSAGTLACEVDGKLVTFGSDSPDWQRVSAGVLAAARALAPTLDFIAYAGEQATRYELISDFYGANFPNSRTGTLDFIRFLQRNASFPALHSGIPDPVELRPEYAHVKQRQLDAIQTTAYTLQDEPEGRLPSQHGVPLEKRIDNADRQLAQVASTILWEKNLPVSGRVSLENSGLIPPEDSTMGHVLNALDNALSTPAFLGFAQEKKIILDSISIAPQTGDLLCKVEDANGEIAQTVFKMADASGWSAVADEIVSLAKSLAAESTTAVRNPLRRRAVYPLDYVLNFYAQRQNAGELNDKLQTCSDLIKEGFTAAKKSQPSNDERSRAFQEKRRALIERLETAGMPPSGTSTSPVTASSAAIDPAAALLMRQFDGEPNLRSVVAKLLSDALKKDSPTLDIDIHQISLATLDPDNPDHFKQKPLIELAMGYLGGDDAPQLSGASRLVDTRPDILAHTGNGPDTPLPVDMKAVERAILALPGQLNDALETALLDYWSQPAFTPPASTGAEAIYSGSHEKLISDGLRNNLRLAGLKQPGLDEQQRETLDLLVRYPRASSRLQATGNDDMTLSLVGSISPPGEGSETSISANVLIQRKMADRTIVLLCEPNGNVTPYESFAAFSEEQQQTLRAQSPDAPPTGALRKVEGDIFFVQAQTIISQRLSSTLSNPAPGRHLDVADSRQRKLPDWVSQASDAERFVLRELSLELASLTQRNKGRTYNSDITDIRPFAEQAFNNHHAVNHPASNLEVVFKVATGATSFGGVSGYIERERMSMVDVLLRNLSGLPSRNVEVYLKPSNTRVPELEQDGALQKLIEDIDVGKNYPALLKRELQDDPVKREQRLALFAQQVPVELQIKALELAVRQQSGFDATGFRYLKEVFNPGPGNKNVEGKNIAIRPLAFVRSPGASPDIVANMYLIEPQENTAGPHILYRPLIADAPLLQFPSRQALMAAIQQPGKLQQDILAWLPDELTRKVYNHGGFTEPHLPHISLDDITEVFTTPPAPTLATDGYDAADALREKLESGQLMEHLYDANAQSLTSLAEQQSVSDQESRWASLKTGGYLLLNALLPALRGPGAAAGVALQFQGILNDIQTLADDNQQNKTSATADLLLTLANLLAHVSQPKPNRPPGTHPAAPIAGSMALPEYSEPPPSKSLIQLGGPMEQVRPIDGEIQTFVDTYNGAQRLNIIGHGEQPTAGNPTRIVGENNKRYGAQKIVDELLARGIDTRQYPTIRLMVCHSADAGPRSLASQLSVITGVPVKGYEGPVTASFDFGENPINQYKNYIDKYKKAYPMLSDGDVRRLAEHDLYTFFAERFELVEVEKTNGKRVPVNVGSLEHPVVIQVPVNYRPVRFGSPKTGDLPAPVSTEGAADIPVQRTSRALRNLSEYAAFKTLSNAEKIADSIVFTQSRDSQYEYFLDGPEDSSEKRLNIVGHGDKGGITFQSDLPGAQSYSPQAFAALITPLIKETGATRIRLVSCRSAQTGFADQLAKALNLPVDAPVGTVTQFEVTKDRFWILEKSPNPRRPHDHEWKTFEGAVV